jgi:hypothetical protein
MYNVDVPMRVGIIWAAACIADNPRLPKLAPHPDDTEGMKFLLERRTDFGPGGWAALFEGGEDIILDRVEGAHHFSMMVSFLLSFFIWCVLGLYMPFFFCPWAWFGSLKWPASRKGEKRSCFAFISGPPPCRRLSLTRDAA